MLVIRSIDVKRVSRDIVELLHMKPALDLREFPREPTTDELNTPVEVVYGKTFINADGNELCIGMSKTVQTAIGLPFEVFEAQQSELDVQRITVAQLRSRHAAAQDKIRQFRAMMLWHRIKFLFNRSSA